NGTSSSAARSPGQRTVVLPSGGRATVFLVGLGRVSGGGHMVTSVEIVRVEPSFTAEEQQAPAGFLSGYRGLTREAYALDLRQFVSWCSDHQIALFAARRVDIERFARDLEARGKARATVARRLCTVAGLYRYAEQEGLIGHSPAVHVRRPRLDYESHVTGLDRNELGALLVAAGLSSARYHALISLLA